MRERGYQEIAILVYQWAGFSVCILTEQLTGLIGGGFSVHLSTLSKIKSQKNFVLYAENVMKIAEVPAEEQQSRLQSIEQRVKQQLAIETIASQTADKQTKSTHLFLSASWQR